MKEATGELNMTVITVVAIAAVGAFFYAFIWPGIQSSLAMNNCKNVCPQDDDTAKPNVKKEKVDGKDTYVCYCGDEPQAI